MNRIGVVAIAAATLSLAACGTSTTDRTLSGAGIGAVGGLAAGSLMGDPMTGALLGGAAGAAGGALTDSRDIDLGRPLWRRF